MRLVTGVVLLAATASVTEGFAPRQSIIGARNKVLPRTVLYSAVPSPDEWEFPGMVMENVFGQPELKDDELVAESNAPAADNVPILVSHAATI